VDAINDSAAPQSSLLKANLYPQIKGGDLVRIIYWLISIVKRPWNRVDVSKTSVNEDYEDTYYNTLSFKLQKWSLSRELNKKK